MFGWMETSGRKRAARQASITVDPGIIYMVEELVIVLVNSLCLDFLLILKFSS